MKILFITATRLGDAVLQMGVLNHINQTWPDAKVTIACGTLPSSLFKGYPQCERLIPMTKTKMSGHWVKLWTKIIGTRWDIVIDLRNSAVSRMIFAKKRYIFGNYVDKEAHKVEQAAAVLKLDNVPDPKLWFTKSQQRKADEIMGEATKIIGIGPMANWRGKTWPAESFIELIERLTRQAGKYEGYHVAIFAAPGEEKEARQVLESVHPKKRIDVIAKTTPGEAAACLSRCELYIGNDSGLMHCAAAAGVKTVGLFGPTFPHLYRPWGENATHIATKKNYDELTDFEGFTIETSPSLMTSLSVDDVYDVAIDF